MVVIRLSRRGAKRRPFFDIVVTDSRSRRDGSFIERIGFFDPVTGAREPLRLALDRITHWVSKGAQISPRVAFLVSKAKKAAAALPATAAAGTPAVAAAAA
jgi:small subunit ribosomal protein S16